MSFIPQYEPLIQKDYADKVHDQIMSGWLGPGQTTYEFEKKICDLTGAKYAIATTSGTTAILISILATCQNVDKIYFPDYTFLAGAHAAKLSNKKVELVDIKSDTLCMNPVIVEQRLDHNDYPGCSLNERSAIMFVNHNGYVGEDRLKIRKLCDDYNILMIEDSSQAIGMKDENGIHAGRIGDVGIFSFSVPKLITTGQGGCIITDDDKIALKCFRLRDQGGDWKETKVHNYLGGNFKFNDILASYGLAQLNIIDDLLLKRKNIFDEYRKYIKIIDYGYESTWMVLYRTQNAKKIIHDLYRHGIQATQYYNPIHTNPSCQTLNDNDDYAFVTSNRIANETIYLPSSLNLEANNIARICQIINNIDGQL